jgi:uncharacterized membrane-anchored protein
MMRAELISGSGMHLLRLPLFVPQHYWRSILLVSTVGLLVAATFRNEVAVMLCSLACAFVFMDYERRRWISVSSHFHTGDILFRLCLALTSTYVFASMAA